MVSTYRIVVGVDGSEGGRRALHWALREAVRRGGTVQAVIAWRRPDPDGPASEINGAIENRQDADRVMAQEADRAIGVGPLPSVAWQATEGRAPRALTQAARDADLLVLGSHGNGRSRHATLGSVSEECIRYAVCPVVVVPVPHPERASLLEEPAIAP